MKRYGLYNHPQARIIGEMVEVEFGTWVRYEDVAAIETKYSEAVELIREIAKDNDFYNHRQKKAKDLLKRHKGDV